MIGGAPWLTRRDYPKLVGGLEAWFDETDPSSMIMDSANRVSLIADKSGNSSTNVLCLNGVAGNYASAPDSAALSLTTLLDIRARVSLNDWSPAAETCLVSKAAAAGQTSYIFRVPSTGANLQLVLSNDGTAATQATSSATVPFTDLSAGWVRVTWRGSDGRVQFFTASDQSGNPSSWTQLGTDQNIGYASIFDSTSILEIGTRLSGTVSPAAGVVYRAQIRNNILDDGTGIVFDANFATAAKLAPSFTESSSNAATVTINTSGATGARISGARDLYQGTAANQPIYLPWSGANYGYLNGVTTSSFSTPDSVPLSITGDIDIAARVTFDSWSAPAATQRIIAKRGSAATISYDLSISITTGLLQFVVSTDGSTAIPNGSSVAPPFAANQTGWVRVTRVASTGLTQFFTASDQSAVPTSWTQLGVNSAGAAGNIYDGATALEIGVTNAGTAAPMTGNVYRAVIYSTIGGTVPVFDFNPAAYSSGTTFLDSSSNAATITINGGAMICTRSGLYSDGVDDYSKTPGFNLPQPATVAMVVEQVSWTNTDCLWAGNVNGAGVFAQDTSTPGISIYPGTTAGAVNSTLPLRTGGVTFGIVSGTSSETQVGRGAATTGGTGTTAMNGFTVAANGNGNTGHGNIFSGEELVYSKNLTATERSRLGLWSARKHRLPAV